MFSQRYKIHWSLKDTVKVSLLFISLEAAAEMKNWSANFIYLNWQRTKSLKSQTVRTVCQKE